MADPCIKADDITYIRQRVDQIHSKLDTVIGASRWHGLAIKGLYSILGATVLGTIGMLIKISL